MKYFLGAATITLGLVCWSTVVNAQTVGNVPAGSVQRSSLHVDLLPAPHVGLLTAEEVNPANFGFRADELQPGSQLVLPSQGGPEDPDALEVDVAPIVAPITELQEPIRVVPDQESDDVTGAGIGFFQSL